MFERELNEQTADPPPRRRASLRVSLRAVVSGLILAVIALNVWPLLLATLPILLAGFGEAAF